MKCKTCESDLHYGDKFCNICGNKVESGAYDEDYAKTIWGKFDKISDWWEKFTLKKFLDNWITKIVILLLVLGWGFFDAYTDLTNIKFLDSEVYAIEYNKKADEYYIRTNDDSVDLNLYIPRYSDKITITEYEGEESVGTRDMLPEEYKEKAITVKKNEFDYITISSVKGEKIFFKPGIFNTGARSIILCISFHFLVF